MAERGDMGATEEGLMTIGITGGGTGTGLRYHPPLQDALRSLSHPDGELQQFFTWPSQGE